MKYLKITPLDTVYFGGGAPFRKGIETFSDAKFSLSPSIFYGAVATAIYVNNSNKNLFGAVLRDKKGNYGKDGFHLKGVFIQRTGSYFPVPYDILLNKNLKGKTAKLNYVKGNIIASFQKTGYYLSGQEEYKESPEGSYASEEFLYDYLVESGTYCNNVIPLKNFVSPESKVGIEKDDETGTSKESMLYNTTFYRIRSGVSFLLSYEWKSEQEYNFPGMGILKVGGRSKSAKYEKVKDAHLLFDEEDFRNKAIKSIKESRDRLFKLYLATPAIFENGWLFDGFNANNFSNGLIMDNGFFKVKIITAAIGKYQSISGWDMLNKSPKTGRRAVPAGSVYYIQIIEGSEEDVFDYFHLKNFGERKEEGFGLTLVGGVFNE